MLTLGLGGLFSRRLALLVELGGVDEEEVDDEEAEEGQEAPADGVAVGEVEEVVGLGAREVEEVLALLRALAYLVVGVDGAGVEPGFVGPAARGEGPDPARLAVVGHEGRRAAVEEHPEDGPADAGEAAGGVGERKGEEVAREVAEAGDEEDAEVQPAEGHGRHEARRVARGGGEGVDDGHGEVGDDLGEEVGRRIEVRRRLAPVDRLLGAEGRRGHGRVRGDDDEAHELEGRHVAVLLEVAALGPEAGVLLRADVRRVAPQDVEVARGDRRRERPEGEEHHDRRQGELQEGHVDLAAGPLEAQGEHRAERRRPPVFRLCVVAWQQLTEDLFRVSNDGVVGDGLE
mmetsp:Transcript_13899/g.45363  ORF Transcript_13899/g.45363 Transcript_13899/m.45363 type:complete len:345 (-) Transcript_13899:1819-2853(-)